MAHSYIEFRGERKIFRDADLLLLMQLAIRTWHQKGGEQTLSSLKPLIECWSKDDEVYGTGCIDLELDDLLPNSEYTQSLITLMEYSHKDLNEHGEIIPGSWLTELANAPALFSYADQKTSRLLELIESFQSFLRVGLK